MTISKTIFFAAFLALLPTDAAFAQGAAQNRGAESVGPQHTAAIARLARFEQQVLSEVNVAVQELQNLSPLLAEARAVRDPARSRLLVQNRIDQGVAAIDAAIIRMQAIQLPDIAPIELPEAYRPAEVLRANMELMAQAREALLIVPETIAALESPDPARAQRAVVRMFDSFRLVFALQIRGLGAQLASDDRDTPDYYHTALLLDFVRSADRLLESLQIRMGGGDDRAMPADMRRLASAIDGNVAALTVAVQNRKAALLDSGVGAGRDAARLERAIERLDVLGVSLGSSFQNFAGALRQLAAATERNPNSLDALQAVIGPLRTMRQEIDENLQEQSSIMVALND